MILAQNTERDGSKDELFVSCGSGSYKFSSELRSLHILQLESQYKCLCLCVCENGKELSFSSKNYTLQSVWQGTNAGSCTGKATSAKEPRLGHKYKSQHRQSPELLQKLTTFPSSRTWQDDDVFPRAWDAAVGSTPAFSHIIPCLWAWPFQDSTRRNYKTGHIKTELSFSVAGRINISLIVKHRWH